MNLAGEVDNGHIKLAEKTGKSTYLTKIQHLIKSLPVNLAREVDTGHIKLTEKKGKSTYHTIVNSWLSLNV